MCTQLILAWLCVVCQCLQRFRMASCMFCFVRLIFTCFLCLDNSKTLAWCVRCWFVQDYASNTLSAYKDFAWLLACSVSLAWFLHVSVCMPKWVDVLLVCTYALSRACLYACVVCIYLCMYVFMCSYAWMWFLGGVRMCHCDKQPRCVCTSVLLYFCMSYMRVVTYCVASFLIC